MWEGSGAEWSDIRAIVPDNLCWLHLFANRNKPSQVVNTSPTTRAISPCPTIYTTINRYHTKYRPLPTQRCVRGTILSYKRRQQRHVIAVAAQATDALNDKCALLALKGQKVRQSLFLCDEDRDSVHGLVSSSMRYDSYDDWLVLALALNTPPSASLFTCTSHLYVWHLSDCLSHYVYPRTLHYTIHTLP